ncbi:MAG: hypothetical protein RMJ89_04735 [Flammeovirgaceae bacterium]|nr:hypothetical protein [Flammeovirgaceae bacterium]
MKNTCLFFLMWFASSCIYQNTHNEEDAIREIAKLKEKSRTDSVVLQVLNSELKAINETLDSASSLNKLFKSDLSFKKKDALSKIKTLDSMLFQSSMKAEMLEIQLRQSNSHLSEMELVQGTLGEKKEQIESQRKYFTDLKKEIEKLKSENVSLKAIIAEKEKELIARDATILQIQEERKKQEEHLKELLKKISEAENKNASLVAERDSIIREATRQKGRIFYETGLIFKEEFDNIDKKTIEIGTGKTKKELIKQAYEYFQKALQLGYADAKREIIILESDKKYSKYLKN